MSFIAVNFANAFDLINARAFATFAEAEAAAHQLLADAPKAVVKVMEIKQVYTATITVQSNPPEPVAPAEPPPEE